MRATVNDWPQRFSRTRTCAAADQGPGIGGVVRGEKPAQVVETDQAHQRRIRRRRLCRRRCDEGSDLARQIDVVTQHRFDRRAQLGRQRGDGRLHLVGNHGLRDQTERQRAERLGAAKRKIDQRRAEELCGDLGKHRSVGKLLRIRRADRPVAIKCGNGAAPVWPMHERAVCGATTRDSTAGNLSTTSTRIRSPGRFLPSP